MTRPLVFSADFHGHIKDDPFVIVDIGARGEFQEPWKTLNATPYAPLKVIGFEPDTVEAERLQKKYGDTHQIFPMGLWDKKGDVTFYLDGGRSSIHGPNLDYLKSFEGRNWKNRKNFQKITVPCTTLDLIVKDNKLSPDFIKCDTQGSEFEILSGAAKTLKSHMTGVIAETWMIEAHKGQKLGFAVESLCHDAGFEMMLRQPRGFWKRGASKEFEQRAQETQHDSLFFKRAADLTAVKGITAVKIMKAAAIAEYYGFTGYAVEILNLAIKQFPKQKKQLGWCINYIIQNNQKTFVQKLSTKIIRRLNQLNHKIQNQNNTREL